MELHVFDPSFTYRGRVQNWINMTWTEEYRGEGKFTLTTYDTDQYAELLRQGYFFYRADRPVAMMAVKVERSTDDNTITVCGYTTLHLLTRRIIDLPHEFVNIESGIYTMIQKDLRNLPGVVTAPVKGLTAEFKCNIEGVVLLDGVFEMLNESSYGIRANFDYANKRHVIEVYDGVDRTYDSQHGGTVFSQEFGNLKSLTVEQDDDLYKNVAYVTGSSDNDPATVYYQYVSPYAGDQANWREMLVSGENQESGESIEEWQDKQEQIAKKALQGYKSALAFEVELGLGVFGKKYDLGDKVTCKSKRYGLQFDTQIMEYQYSYKQGVEKVKVVLGDRPLDYVQSSIAKSSGSGGGMKITGGGGSSTGTPGEPGKDGEDGVGIASVVQTTTSTADGGENIITVTLTDGSSIRFSVRNGSKGSTGADGKDGSPGKNGVDGKDGSDGYTPVHGVDYWTAADKQEIIDELSAATGGGSVNEIATLTAEEYEALTTEEKAALYAQGVRVLAVESAFDADSLTDMQKFAAFAHPVGEIVELTVATNPATLWGFGTWESFMPGRVLVGAGTADGGTVYTAGATGGEETHTLTVDEMPSHDHADETNYIKISVGSSSNWAFVTNDSQNRTTRAGSVFGYNVFRGGSEAHNNMQPYGVVYRWLRTA